MRFKVVGFSYQTQILQKSVPEHRTPPQIFFECAPLFIDTISRKVLKEERSIPVFNFTLKKLEVTVACISTSTMFFIAVDPIYAGCIINYEIYTVYDYTSVHIIIIIQRVYLKIKDLKFS